MAPGKKKGLSTPMEERLAALKRIDRGDSLKDVAFELGLAVDTIRRWKVDRKRIEGFCSRAKKRQSSNITASNEYLNEAVFAWYILRRRQGVAVTGTMIQNKALDFYELMEGSEKFHGFSGWLNTWQQEYGIRLFEPSEEKVTDASAVLAFTRRFLTIIEKEGLTRDQIFTCEETEIYYKMLPSKTNFARMERDAPGLESNRDRVTVLACSNASGTLKLPLMVIGKIANPRSLEHLNMESLPVFYAHNNRVRMDHELFKEWFNIEFIPRVTRFLRGRGLPLKALLIIDDSPSHPPEKDLTLGAIKTMFFPHNMTCHMQPMNQGVLENLKRRFLYKMLLETQDDSGEIVQRLKNVSMKDVIFWAVEAWEGISPFIIEQSWQICSTKGLKKNAPKHVDISNAQFLQIFQRIKGCQHVDEKNVQQWIEKNVDAMENLSDQEILSMVMRDQEDGENYERRDESFSGHEMAMSTAAGYSKQTERSHDMARGDTLQFSSDEEMDASPAARYSKQSEDSHDMARGRAQQLHSNEEMVKSTAASYSRRTEGSHDTEEGEILQCIKTEHEERDPLSDQAIHSMATAGAKGKPTAAGDFHQTEDSHDLDKGDPLQWIKKEYENLVTDTVTRAEVTDFNRTENCRKVKNYEDPLSVLPTIPIGTREEGKKAGNSLGDEAMDYHVIKSCQDVGKDQQPPPVSTVIPTVMEHRREGREKAAHSSGVEIITSSKPMDSHKIGGGQNVKEDQDHHSVETMVPVVMEGRREEANTADNSADVEMVASPPAMGSSRNKNCQDASQDVDPLSDNTMVPMAMEEEKRNKRPADSGLVTSGEVMGFRRKDDCQNMVGDKTVLTDHTIIHRIIEETQVGEQRNDRVLDSGMATSTQITDFSRNENCQNANVDRNPLSGQAMIPMVMESKNEEEKRDHIFDSGMVTSTGVMNFHGNEIRQNVGGNQNPFSGQAMIPLIIGNGGEQEKRDHLFNSGMVTSAGVMDFRRNENCPIVSGNENPLSNQAYILIVHDNRRDESTTDRLLDSSMVTSAGIMDFRRNEDCGSAQNRLSGQALITTVQESVGDKEQRDRLIDKGDSHRNKECQDLSGDKNLISAQPMIPKVTESRREKENRDRLLGSQVAHRKKDPLSDHSMIPEVIESRREEEKRDRLSNTEMVRSADVMYCRRNEDTLGMDQPMTPMEHSNEEEQKNRQLVDSEMVTFPEDTNFHKIDCSRSILREHLEQSIKKEYDDTDPLPYQEVKCVDPLDGGEASSVGMRNSSGMENFQAIDDEVQIKREYEAVDPLFIEMQDEQIDESDRDDDGCPSEMKKLTAVEAVEALSYIIKICEDMEDITIEELQLLYKYKDLILLQNYRKRREEQEKMDSNESADKDKL